MTRLSWRDQAICAGVKGFTELGTAQQQAVCKDCPVAIPCLEFALEWERTDRPSGDKHGWPVYGAMSARQRLDLIRGQV